MKPSIYLYEETPKGIQLYLGECSTMDGLSIIDEKTPIDIISFGATCYKKYGWATESELPDLPNVGNVLSFLGAEGDIGIVDFEASLEGIGAFSTHDDAECHYILNSKHLCMDLLTQVIQPEFRDLLINALLSNQGLYITCNQSGVITKYGSFDEYLSKSA